MRILTIALLAFGLAASADAFAGKKGGDAPAGDQPSTAQYAPITMESTQVPDFDSFFDTAKAPLQSLQDARKQIDQATKDMNVALGVAENTPFKDAISSLQKTAEGKVKTVEHGKMPRLEAKDAVPDNVQKGIDAVNKFLDEVEAAEGNIESVKPQIEELATKSADMVTTAPDTIKSAGVPAPQIPKSLAAVKKNAKTIADHKDEPQKVMDSVVQMGTDLSAAFGA